MCILEILIWKKEEYWNKRYGFYWARAKELFLMLNHNIADIKEMISNLNQSHSWAGFDDECKAANIALKIKIGEIGWYYMLWPIDTIQIR